jgi:hypothetical protein
VVVSQPGSAAGSRIASVVHELQPDALPDVLGVGAA